MSIQYIVPGFKLTTFGTRVLLPLPLDHCYCPSLSPLLFFSSSLVYSLLLSLSHLFTLPLSPLLSLIYSIFLSLSLTLSHFIIHLPHSFPHQLNHLHILINCFETRKNEILKLCFYFCSQHSLTGKIERHLERI